MELIANDLPRFEQDISDYNSAKLNLDKNYEMLVAHMNELNNMWEGEAHNQFLETFQADSVRVAEMLDVLKEIHSQLRFAHTEYTGCENTELL